MLWNSKGLTRCFSSTLNLGGDVNIMTLYTIIFGSDCTRLYCVSLTVYTLTRVCNSWKQPTTHSATSHFSQQRSVLLLFLFIEQTWRLCLPLAGQCFECFTSSLLSWASDELGLPRETPLTVIFASCDWRIKSRTKISRNFLCVIFPSHDLCNRYALRIVMSRRWKNNFSVYLHVLRAMPLLFTILSDLSTKPMCAL